MYERILNGDETAIQELWDFLYRFSINHWNNKTVDFFRQDYVNEAVWKILNNLDYYRGQAKFTTWATSIFINFVTSKIREQCHRTSYNDQEYEGTIQINDNAILIDELFHLVVPDHVTEDNFHMLVDYTLGRTAEEVCQDYGVANPNALYIRMFRTKKAILEAVGKDFLT